MALTQLECFQATVAHESHEGFLFYIMSCSTLEEKVRKAYNLDDNADLFQALGMWEHCPKGEVNLLPPEDLEQTDVSSYYADIDNFDHKELDYAGVLRQMRSEDFYHIISPLRKAQSFKDIESFPYLSYEGYSDDHLVEGVRKIHQRNRTAYLAIGHTFEEAWRIRGDDIFADMILHPDWVEYMLGRIMERHLVKAKAAAHAGVDFLRTGDDLGMQKGLMFSIEHWRHFIKPRWEKVYQTAKEINPDIKIWYHSDGKIEPVIPELIEIGVDILNPVQAEVMDPAEIKKLYGDKLVFDGTIGTQSTLPFGTPEDVRRVVRERVKTCGQDGALILSPTHILGKEVPLENVKAFIETVKEYGELQ